MVGTVHCSVLVGCVSQQVWLCCLQKSSVALVACAFFSDCPSQVPPVTSCRVEIYQHILRPSSPRKAYAAQSHAAVQADEDRGEFAIASSNYVEFAACPLSQATCRPRISDIRTASLCLPIICLKNMDDPNVGCNML